MLISKGNVELEHNFFEDREPVKSLGYTKKNIGDRVEGLRRDRGQGKGVGRRKHRQGPGACKPISNLGVHTGPLNGSRMPEACRAHTGQCEGSWPLPDPAPSQWGRSQCWVPGHDQGLLRLLSPTLISGAPS